LKILESLYGVHSRPNEDPLFIINIIYDYSNLTWRQIWSFLILYRYNYKW